SEKMLVQLRKNYPYVKTFFADVRDLKLPQGNVDVAFLNACYPNIADKVGAFTNISKMIKHEGRVVISHPMGKKFIFFLKDRVSFPLDVFPDKRTAMELFKPFGFEVGTFVDESELYILVLKKAESDV
ncbi:MAG: methyltransferase domain-containing protein, partial [Deltaproteobacteria bacterium]|nr:methyltransferase domain-containing protein [Deltaproteobacteria bacterium]